jgi:glycosyltransferase involved in cell wall biosynthesis
MRIIYLENEDINTNSSGGILTYINNLINYCHKQNIESVFFANGDSGKKDKRFVSLSTDTFQSNFQFFLNLFKSPEIKRICKTDIVHVQRSEMVIPLWFRTKSKIVCTLHGGQDRAVYKKKGVFPWLVYFIMQTIGFYLADYLIAVDKKNRDRYCKYYPWIRKKITIIPIGIDIDKFVKKEQSQNGNIKILQDSPNFSNNSETIIFIGRLEPEKNISFLLEVVNELNRDQFPVNFLIIGEGSEKSKLESLVENQHLKNVIFIGNVDNNNLHQFLAISQVLVLSSFFEGSPTVVKEALASNVKVVSFDVGDVGLVLSQIPDGGFIANNSISDFKEKIIRALSISFSISEVELKWISLNQMGNNTLKIYTKISRQGG